MPGDLTVGDTGGRPLEKAIVNNLQSGIRRATSLKKSTDNTFVVIIVKSFRVIIPRFGVSTDNVFFITLKIVKWRIFILPWKRKVQIKIVQ